MPDTASRDAAFCSVLNRELVCALGCTEPIAVAYAAALARETLGCEPETLEVACSGNIIKNVKSVTVPNSGGMHGIEAAAALGAVGGDPADALEVLEGVGDADRARAGELLARPGFCDVRLAEGVPNLYIKVSARAAAHVAQVEIREHHTNVTLRTLDGAPVCGRAEGDCASCAEKHAGEGSRGADDIPLTIESILDFIEGDGIDGARAAVVRQIELNGAISDEGLAYRWGAEVGRTLLGARADDIACRARARAAAGSDARMNGCALPVVIVCGSGNQGITCSLPVMTYAEYLRCDHERLVRAVMLSDLVAVHVKSYIGALSAFCGVVCAACGAGAAITWLCGGTRGQIGATVSNTLGNVGGIVCDGAKASCAAKISAAVDAAILGHDMAMQGRGFRAGEGLIRDTVEQTIASMGYVGRVGMKDTDVEILNIMIGKTAIDC